MKNLRYDNVNACCIPYDNPPPDLTRQLQRLVTEERPGPALAAGMKTAAAHVAARFCAA